MDVFVTRGGEIAATMAGDLGVVFTRAAKVTDEAWSEYVELQIKLRRSNPAPEVYVLNFAPDVSLTGTQRRYFNHHSEQLRLDTIPKVALITNSTLTRGMFTAMGWLQRGPASLRAFAETETRAAMQWLADSGCSRSVAEMESMLNTVVRAAERAATQGTEALGA